MDSFISNIFKTISVKNIHNYIPTVGREQDLKQFVSPQDPTGALNHIGTCIKHLTWDIRYLMIWSCLLIKFLTTLSKSYTPGSNLLAIIPYPTPTTCQIHAFITLRGSCPSIKSWASSCFCLQIHSCYFWKTLSDPCRWDSFIIALALVHFHLVGLLLSLTQWYNPLKLKLMHTLCILSILQHVCSTAVV